MLSKVSLISETVDLNNLTLGPLLLGPSITASQLWFVKQIYALTRNDWESTLSDSEHRPEREREEKNKSENFL